MTKKLTLTDIEQEIKVFDVKEKVELSDKHHLFIYPNFSPSKIAELIKELMMDEVNAKKANLDLSEINHGDWFFFNIIRKFTDLGIPNDIKKKIQAFKLILDSDYFNPIIKSFPEESMEKISNALAIAKKNFDIYVQAEMSVNEAIEKASNEAIDE